MCLCVFTAMLQADDEDDMMEMQMKSPFGSSFRTFNATDYKPIGQISAQFHPISTKSVCSRSIPSLTKRLFKLASSGTAQSGYAHIAKLHHSPGSFECIRRNQ